MIAFTIIVLCMASCPASPLQERNGMLLCGQIRQVFEVNFAAYGTRKGLT